MAPLIGYNPPRVPGARMTPPDVEMVELPLLLPRWQAAELEQAAVEIGMTPAQMLRRLICETLAARVAE